MPHWDRGCRSNFLSHPVTVYWHWANQSLHWPYNTRHRARKPQDYQLLSYWYDFTQKKIRGASGNWTEACCSRGGRLYHLANEVVDSRRFFQPVSLCCSLWTMLCMGFVLNRCYMILCVGNSSSHYSKYIVVKKKVKNCAFQYQYHHRQL